MRWMYARQDPADNMLFGYKKADEVRRQFYLMLYNVYRYFVEYANLDKFNSNLKTQNSNPQLKSQSVLDTWIVNRLNWLIKFAKDNLKNYNAKDAALESEKFVSDLSTWYIRRSRERVWVNSSDEADKQSFYETLNHCLVNLSIILSPILPFITEEIYTTLTEEPSVHLASWPQVPADIDNNLISDMELVREIVEVGHRVRKENKIKVRQILKSIKLQLPKNKTFAKKEYEPFYLSLIKDELNVKEAELQFHESDVIEVTYDTVLTQELKKEGETREIIRTIQQERKKLGLQPQQPVIVTLIDYPQDYADLIKRKVVATELKKGDSILIEPQE